MEKLVITHKEEDEKGERYRGENFRWKKLTIHSQTFYPHIHILAEKPTAGVGLLLDKEEAEELIRVLKEAIEQNFPSEDSEEKEFEKLIERYR